MAHHGDDATAIPMNNLTDEAKEQLRRLQQVIPERGFPDLGATNRFPQGKLNPNDEGEIMFAVAADKSQGKVLINFGKPIAWIGMDREQAIEFANLLKRKADDLLDITKQG